MDNIFARALRSTRQHRYENEALGQGSGDQFVVGHFEPVWFSFTKSHRSSGYCGKLEAKTQTSMTTCLSSTKWRRDLFISIPFSTAKTIYVSILFVTNSCYVLHPLDKSSTWTPPSLGNFSLWPPSPSEIPATFRGGGGMDIFWNHTMRTLLMDMKQRNKVFCPFFYLSDIMHAMIG